MTELWSVERVQFGDENVMTLCLHVFLSKEDAEQTARSMRAKLQNDEQLWIWGPCAIGQDILTSGTCYEFRGEELVEMSKD